MTVPALITVEVTEWEELSVPEDEPLTEGVVQAAAADWANSHSFNLIAVHQWNAPRP